MKRFVHCFCFLFAFLYAPNSMQALGQVSSPIAPDTLDEKWPALLQQYKISPNEQSFCYTNSNHELKGVNLDLRVRIASITKLIISKWALDSTSPNYRFKTKLYIKNNQLHIEGSYDPFFGNEKIFFLLSQLNRLGIYQFKKITFDRNLIIFPDAHYYVGTHPVITPQTVERDLKTYFNSKDWTKTISDELQLAVQNTKDLPENIRINSNVDFFAPDISFVTSNPFKDQSNVRILTLSSSELKTYLKETNIKSNNYTAHTMFLWLGGDLALQNYLQKKYQFNNELVRLYTGSGLPLEESGVRRDNFATCRSVHLIMEDLKNTLEANGEKLESIMAVPGSDPGTFTRRLNNDDIKNSFIVKTGTLMHTSTLAGALSTNTGLHFFGIYHQTTDIISAKTVQDAMVFKMIEEFGGPLKFPYNPGPFFSVDEDVKNKKRPHEDDENNFHSFGLALF